MRGAAPRSPRPPAHAVESHHVGAEGAVGVAEPLAVDHAHQLGEKHHVHQVGGQVPQTVDGLDREGHGRGQDAHGHDGELHYPDDFSLGGLAGRTKKIRIISSKAIRNCKV
ncbi:hypothetical protein CEXT_676821 [Caerostris extrusa]|uniref:Uncharacterized protein n=1 Tax=Caerostris extrusa TaxID=172846 RepID=A0AAV4UIE7_CAEEX|nr:hypothetical protein CEXT_676821 [Caerostris extrusa]